jgi:hypothetical protein
LPFFEEYKNCLLSNFRRLIPLEEGKLLQVFLNMMGMIFFTFLGKPIYQKAFKDYIANFSFDQFLEIRKREITNLTIHYVKNLLKGGEK